MSSAAEANTPPAPNEEARPEPSADDQRAESTSTNVGPANEQDAPSIADHKLHRRDPLAVRREVRSIEDLAAETTLADVQLREMPGLHNTEQWKRIAARSGQLSPPLSRQYYQSAAPTLDLQTQQVSQILGSYRRPGRTESVQDSSDSGGSKLRTRRCTIFFALGIIGVAMIVIAIAAIVAIVVQKPKEGPTDYYSGYIVVQARFDPQLQSPTSTLAKNYQREFCSLVYSTLESRKTKYAVFYSTCVVYNFRNGSVIGDFTLGFTRYQNVTRLNAFLDRTIINAQLFGGTISSIVFNSTNNDKINDTDYDVDYDGPNSARLALAEEAIVLDSPLVSKSAQDEVEQTALPPANERTNLSGPSLVE